MPGFEDLTNCKITSLSCPASKVDSIRSSAAEVVCLSIKSKW
jgi:hypothetical protein